MLAMVRKLHFNVEPNKVRGSDIEQNEWILQPYSGLYSNIHEVRISTKYLADENIEFEITFRMCENPDGVDKGIQEDISYNFNLRPDEVTGPDGDVAFGPLSDRINKLIREAIVKFDESLMLRR
jgi:hypothetical protein